MRLEILFLTLLFLAHCATAAADKSHVVVLNETNFEEYIAKPVIMVKFYAEWCGHCQILAPEYEKFAKIVVDLKLDYIVAELDAPNNPKAAQIADIKHFPTIKLYINGTAVEYSGDKKAKKIFEFLAQKVLPPSTGLKDDEEIKEALEEKGRKCFLISDKKEAVKHYMALAKNADGYKFYHLSEEQGKKAFPDIKVPAIILLKDYGEKVVVYKEALENEKFSRFLAINKYPILDQFNDDNIRAVFQKSDRKGVLFLYNGTSEDIKKKEAEFRLFAEQNQHEKVIFISGNLDTEIGRPLVEFYSLQASDLPLVEIADGEYGRLKRFKHKGEITLPELTKFLSDFREGKIEKYMKSEPEPKENAGPVYIAVGSTFTKEVVENDMDVVVKFYASWCGHSKKFEPIFKQLAEKLIEVKTLKFVELEVTKNEINETVVANFPTVMLFPAKDKSTPILLEEDKTEENILKFLKEKCSHSFEVPKTEKKADL